MLILNSLPWAVGVDLYPADLWEEIDKINDFIYDKINNGVYKAGFATTQKAHEEAVFSLFSSLASCDEALSQQPFLAGTDYPTIADWRLFTTLIRFDLVYYAHFK